MSYEQALPVILKFEGGYSNDPDDPGGATNFGIIQRTYDAYRIRQKLPKQSVKLITGSEVQHIYRENYWMDCGAWKMPINHPKSQLMLFDCAVNCGTFWAVKLFQRSLGVKDDGVFGPKTLEAVFNTDDNTLAQKYAQERKWYYDSLITTKPNLTKFKDSWFHRVDSILNMNLT